jgi:hypothetical protein
MVFGRQLELFLALCKVYNDYQMHVNQNTTGMNAIPILKWVFHPLCLDRTL